MLNAFADFGANGVGRVDVCKDNFGRLGIAGRWGARTEVLMLEGVDSGCAGDAGT